MNLNAVDTSKKCPPQMQLPLRELSQDRPWPVREWLDRAARQMMEIADAFAAKGCGWLTNEFALPANFGSSACSMLDITLVGPGKVLLSHNLTVRAGALSTLEMAAVIAYQCRAWTPNLQNWPLTVWSKTGNSQEASESETGSTLCIPLHGPRETSSLFFVQLASLESDWRERALQFVGPLLALEGELRSTLAASQADERPSLSRDEIASLSWAAHGKTAWESARIQGISERAVIHRLRRAREKLGAGSTALAISTALRLGLVDDAQRLTAP